MTYIIEMQCSINGEVTPLDIEVNGSRNIREFIPKLNPYDIKRLIKEQHDSDVDNFTITNVVSGEPLTLPEGGNLVVMALNLANMEADSESINSESRADNL